MDLDYLRLLAEELADKHSDKFLFALEKPEFKSWFIGRLSSECDNQFDKKIVERVIDDLMGQKFD